MDGTASKKIQRRSREVPLVCPVQCWHGAVIGHQYQLYLQLVRQGVSKQDALTQVGLPMDMKDPQAQCECCRAMLLGNNDLTFIRSLYLDIAAWAEGRSSVSDTSQQQSSSSSATTRTTTTATTTATTTTTSRLVQTNTINNNVDQ